MYTNTTSIWVYKCTNLHSPTTRGNSKMFNQHRMAKGMREWFWILLQCLTKCLFWLKQLNKALENLIKLKKDKRSIRKWSHNRWHYDINVRIGKDVNFLVQKIRIQNFWKVRNILRCVQKCILLTTASVISDDSLICCGPIVAFSWGKYIHLVF